MHVDEFPELGRFSSGLLNLDSILGGGVPIGRIIEIFGPESSGKTALVTKIAEARIAEGIPVGFVDAERTTTGARLASTGIDLTSKLFYLFEADHGDEALGALEDFAKEGFGLVIIDSVPYLKPAIVMDNDIEKAEVALTAKLLAKMQNRIVAAAANNACTVIFINQLRTKIGANYGANPETTMGGHALKHMCSVRLKVNPVFDEKLKKKDPGAIKTRITCIKNKTAGARQACDVEIYPATGCDPFMAAIEAMALPHVSLISQRGAYYYIKPELVDGIEVPKLQGLDSVVRFFREKPALFNAIYERALKVQNVIDEDMFEDLDED